MALVDDIRDYVNRSHAYAWLNCTGKAPDEPALISSLLSQEMYLGLRDALRKRLPTTTDVSVRGIFTHQTPQVQMDGETQSVEIADLMLVHQHFNRPGHSLPYGNALLFQAKRTAARSTGSVNSGTQRLQFELYQSWKPFVGKGRLPPAPPGFLHWDFRHGNVVSQAKAVQGAEYLTVYDMQAYSVAPASPQWMASLLDGPAHSSLVTAYSDQCTWSAGGTPDPYATAADGVDCPLDFGRVFTGFLNGTHGRSFRPGVIDGRNHWSVFVNTMLLMSAAASSRYVYNSKNQRVVSRVRSREVLQLAAQTAMMHTLEAELDEFESRHRLMSGPTMHIPVFRRLYRGLQQAGSRPHRLFNSRRLASEKGDGGEQIPMLIVTTVGGDQPFLGG